MSDTWIKQEIIRGRYPEFKTGEQPGQVDQDGLITKSLEDLEDHEAEYEDFGVSARWMKMRVLVRNFLTDVRKYRGQAKAEEEAGQMSFELPGFEEVDGDHVEIGGERYATIELGPEQLAAVILGYRQQIGALEKALMFYVVLQQHVVANGAESVKELYAA